MNPQSRETVSVSPELHAQAPGDFPPERTVDGAPCYGDFVRGPLDAAVRYFSRQFDISTPSIPGNDAIKQMTTLSPFFGAPIVFYAMRVGTGIEITSYLFDDSEDYWGETIGSDPND